MSIKELVVDVVIGLCIAGMMFFVFIFAFGSTPAKEVEPASGVDHERCLVAGLERKVCTSDWCTMELYLCKDHTVEW